MTIYKWGIWKPWFFLIFRVYFDWIWSTAEWVIKETKFSVPFCYLSISSTKKNHQTFWRVDMVLGWMGLSDRVSTLKIENGRKSAKTTILPIESWVSNMTEHKLSVWKPWFLLIFRVLSEWILSTTEWVITEIRLSVKGVFVYLSSGGFPSTVTKDIKSHANTEKN
jgi:hypothetical protein